MTIKITYHENNAPNTPKNPACTIKSGFILPKSNVSYLKLIGDCLPIRATERDKYLITFV